MKTIAALLFVISFFAGQAIAAPFPLKSHVCEAYLVQASSAFRSQEAQSKEELLESMRSFRFYTLREVDSEPSITAASIDSKSLHKKSKRKKVGDRIRGIEAFANQPSDSEGGNRPLTWGTKITGAAAITEWMHDFEESVEAFEEIWNRAAYSGNKITSLEDAFRDQEKNAKFWTLLTLTLGIPSAVIPLLFHAAQFGPKRFAVAASIAIPASLFTIFLLGLDYFYRRPFYWDYSYRSKLLALRKTLTQIESGEDAFHFDSQNSTILKDLAQASYDGVAFSFNSLHDQNAFTGESFFNKNDSSFSWQSPRTHQRDNFQWLGIDRLLRKNPKTGEAELTIVLRSSTQRPEFPSTSKNKSSVGLGRFSSAHGG